MLAHGVDREGPAIPFGVYQRRIHLDRGAGVFTRIMATMQNAPEDIQARCFGLT